MGEKTIANLDRIMFRGNNAGPNGRPEIAVMHIPQWSNRFTYNPGGMLVEGIDILDTTHVNPKTNEHPTLYIAGALVEGEQEIPLEDGLGAIHLGETYRVPDEYNSQELALAGGQTLLVDVTRLTNKLANQARPTSGISYFPRRSSVQAQTTPSRYGW